MLRDRIGKALPDPLKRALYDRYRAFVRLRNRRAARDGIATLHGIRLRVDPGVIGEAVVERILLGDYEGREARMLRMFLAPGDRVLELGAGLGFIGLLCARTVGGANVHSFEANPTMEPIIRDNYALNGPDTPNLTIGLLSPEPGAEAGGEAVLHVPDLFWASSMTPMAGGKAVRTPRYSLAERIAALQPTFLVMDIEGGEIDVVTALEPGPLRKIAMELHPEITGQAAIDAMTAHLRGLGFERRWISNAGQHVYFEAA